jgi:hypothetical protein
MWYHRFVSWVRSLFTESSQVNDEPAPFDSDTPTLPMTAPLRGPFGVRDERASLPPIVEFPALREPPTTVPLARIARPSEPLTGMPPNGEISGPSHISWLNREPAPPSQPSQPLIDSRRMMDPLWAVPEAEDTSEERSDVEDETLAIEPGSELYRRLMILRRLVRQGIYSEGFARDQTPEQYRRYPGMDASDTPFDAE